MKYTFESWSISELLAMYDNNKLNLNPPYQRNDIWSLPAKKKLIDSIRLGYPLPAFFLHEKENGEFDIVDGQQRTRTFLGYRKKLFHDNDKQLYDTSTEALFNEYKISVGLLKTYTEAATVEDFYFRVNNFGVKLNRAEIKRAEFPDSKFQALIEELKDENSFTSLGLFTKQAENRLADLDFVSELLSLLYFGITDKKIAADRMYESQSITNEEFTSLKNQFIQNVTRIAELNQIYPINKSRYKQRNDFYTLFSFLQKHGESLTDELLIYQYKLLILIGDDIYPSNDKCWSFHEYAENCVSQSNSKNAREKRLLFFENLLLNQTYPFPEPRPEDTDESEVIFDTLKFYGLETIHVREVQNYHLVDIYELLKIKHQFRFYDEI